MSRLMDILGIGKSGLFASQNGIHTSGQNIANVNTENYSRQRTSFETMPPEVIRNGQLGSGVQLESVTRQIDQLTENQIIQQRSTLGEFNAQSSVLQQIEMFFNENNGSSLGESMDQFFNSWRDLTNNPSDINQRMEVLERGEELASTFHKDFNHIFDTQLALNEEISGRIDQINQMVEEISTLNVMIHGSEVLPSNANDLRDKQDLLVKNLGEMVNLDTFYDEKGFLSILTGQGIPLVVGADYNTLEAHPGTNGMMEIHHIRPNGVETDITNDLQSGELAGIIYVRDQILEDYKTQINELAFEMVQQVNTIHQTGYDLDSNTNTDFFANLLGVTNAARDIDLSITVLDNPDGIAASATLDLLGDVVPGDNQVALQLSDMQYALTMNGGNDTFNESYRNLIYQIGHEKLANENYIEVESAKMTQLENFREAVSGVSLDEEMVNIIQFQRAFEANSKVITTTDQMLQVVLSLKD